MRGESEIDEVTPCCSGMLIHEIFEHQVARKADAVAVACGEETLTYGELDRRANDLAGRLLERGSGPEAITAIFLDRSPELIVAILAVLKAGGAYLPIDLAYPKERVAFMLEDAQVHVLLTRSDLVTKLPVCHTKVVCLDDTQPTACSTRSVSPAKPASRSSVAYVIYTSGSTGQPKGALITHHNVIRLFQSTEQWFRFGPQDTWTLFHSSAFDFSVWEIWGALLYGGRLIIVPYITSRSPDAFRELLSREQVTVLNQTPSAFRQLIRADEAAPESRLLTLRYVIFGGEALEMQSLKPWFDRYGDQHPQLVNMYGITETTVHVTYRPLTKKDVASGSVIGKPIPDLQVHILDTDLKPVSPGVSGEMFVGGEGLARGYLNRPELTAERFIRDPFSLDPGARLYRTGDLARFLANGDLEYLGRIDDQVKIRGFRVELGEIESALRRHPSVREAIVLARGTGRGDKRLIAYLVLRSQTNSRELREHLRPTLPEYMVPAGFLFLEKMPLTHNGKVDRSALRAMPDQEPKAFTPASMASPNQLEREILGIWSDVLKGASFGLDDNFFEIGGDSLLLTQVHLRLKAFLGKDFPITDLFAHTTVRALAAYFTRAAKAGIGIAAQERAKRQRAILATHGVKPVN